MLSENVCKHSRKTINEQSKKNIQTITRLKYRPCLTNIFWWFEKKRNYCHCYLNLNMFLYNLTKTWIKPNLHNQSIERNSHMLTFSLYTALPFYTCEQEIMNRKTLNTGHVRLAYEGVALCRFQTFYSIKLILFVHLKDLFCKRDHSKDEGKLLRKQRNSIVTQKFSHKISAKLEIVGIQYIVNNLLSNLKHTDISSLKSLKNTV